MENTSPHSAMARAKTVRIGRKGVPIKPPKPSPHESAIPRRIARGALLMTMIEGKPAYTYEDGTEITSGKARFGYESFREWQFNRFVQAGWIVADPSAPALLPGETPQRYIIPPLRA